MTYVAVSNSSLSGVRDAVRMQALGDFGYFANVVFGATIPEELCDLVQNSLTAQESARFRTEHSRKLAYAASAWLTSHGISVMGIDPPRRHDLLSWLEMSEQPPSDYCVVIRLTESEVEFEWL